MRGRHSRWASLTSKRCRPGAKSLHSADVRAFHLQADLGRERRAL